jgi:hypothetical protein
MRIAQGMEEENVPYKLTKLGVTLQKHCMRIAQGMEEENVPYK